jgi:enamine deaminase RidA (YjgF/YER057c/UK114 family)
MARSFRNTRTLSDRVGRERGDMTEKTLLRPEGLVRSAAFSHVAVVPPGATTVYIGGQNAVDDEGNLVGEGDPAAQTRQVMTNLHIALASAGASVHDLVLMTIVVVDGVDVSEAYPLAAASLDGAAPPVTVMRVTGLAVRGALIEVGAVAAVST